MQRARCAEEQIIGILQVEEDQETLKGNRKKSGGLVFPTR